MEVISWLERFGIGSSVFMINWGGVDFSSEFENIPKEIGNRYTATSPRILWNAKMKELMKNFSEKDSILDVGCGKGRMLVFFKKYSFAKVDGLEYSNELVEIAKSNMSKLNLDCRIYQGNAKEWDKYGNYNVFYLFNPFNGSTMEGFINKLIESYRINNRKITVIYFNPREDAMFMDNYFRKETIDESLNMYIYG